MTTRTTVLNELIRLFGYRRYLEIGCDADWTFGQINAPIKVGVDPVRGGTHRMTSNEFFRQWKSRFDLVFIDGLHHAEQVERDIDNSLARLEAGGCIVVHDCMPVEEVHQKREQCPGAWTGDVWKAFAKVRTRHDLDAAVLDSDWGVGIIWKRPNTDPVTLPDALTWEVFQSQGRKLLRVLDVEAFWRFVHPPCKVAAITCTADRPGAVSLLRKYMSRQTIPPYRWFVVDSGHVALDPQSLDRAIHLRTTPRANPWDSFHHNLLDGITAGLESGADAIAFVEDDDWYSPAYLARASAAMSQGFDVWGDGAVRFWHVGYRKLRLMHMPKCAMTALTVVSRKAAQQAYEQRSREPSSFGYFEGCLWNGTPLKRHVAARGLKLHVGLKGMYQVAMSSDHYGDPWADNSAVARPDKEGKVLRMWIGDDADAYLDWVAPESYSGIPTPPIAPPKVRRRHQMV